MKPRKKRVYRSETREAQAEETRKRILEAAKKLFKSEGFEGVTIDRLAKEAEVSSPTIYAIFQSKRGVLRALIDEAISPKEFEALVESGKQEKSPKTRLKISAKMARQIYDAEKALMDFFQSAAVLAPEFKELEREREERRYDRQEEFVKALAKEKDFKKGLALKEARDILWAFTGRDMYRLFVIGKGWTPEAYEHWLAELLASQLLET